MPDLTTTNDQTVSMVIDDLEPHETAQTQYFSCAVQDCGLVFATSEELTLHKQSHDIKTETKPEITRDDKGRIVIPIPQDTNKNGTAGRPCRLCKNNDEYLNKIKDYFQDCRNATKPKIPFLEEIALMLDCHRETLTEWAKNKEEHPEFSDIIQKVQTLQSLRLQQRVLGRYNPTGAISLLKWHHGMIETEKRILTGGGQNDEPLEIRIVEDKQHVE